MYRWSVITTDVLVCYTVYSITVNITSIRFSILLSIHYFSSAVCVHVCV